LEGAAFTRGPAAEDHVLKLALFFLIVSLIAGPLGFTGIAMAAAGIAKILFFVFLALFVIVLAVGMLLGAALF
jgi:uncharacterized membrane protein YtjA (UPF0391 family)